MTDPGAAPPKLHPLRRMGCIGWSVIVAFTVVMIFVLIAALGTSDPGSKDNAIGICRSFVKDKLKAPATAEFSIAEAEGKAGRWVVYGSVDAQNSFGAKIRNYYRCPVRYAGDKTWKTTGRVLLGDAPYRR